jgi:hypothetical protein
MTEVIDQLVPGRVCVPRVLAGGSTPIIVCLALEGMRIADRAIQTVLSTARTCSPKLPTTRAVPSAFGAL